LVVSVTELVPSLTIIKTVGLMEPLGKTSMATKFWKVELTALLKVKVMGPVPEQMPVQLKAALAALAAGGMSDSVEPLVQVKAAAAVVVAIDQLAETLVVNSSRVVTWAEANRGAAKLMEMSPTRKKKEA
jgi:hypothetical protein